MASWLKRPLPKNFAQRVLEILDKPSLYRKFSATSQKIAADFSEENQAKKLLKIYKNLVKK